VLITTPGAPAGILTLFAPTGAARLLTALAEAAARAAPGGAPVAVAALVPAPLAGGVRKARLQVSSTLTGAPAPGAPGAPLLAGALAKRGAVRAAFQVRAMTLALRDERTAWFAPMLARSASSRGEGGALGAAPPAALVADRLALPVAARAGLAPAGGVPPPGAPLAAARAGKAALVVSYAKGVFARGEFGIWSAAAGARVLSLSLDAAPGVDVRAAARSGALLARLFGDGTRAGETVFSVATDARVWTFSTPAGADAAAWLVALSLGLRARAATLAATLPPLRGATAPFASTSGLCDASFGAAWAPDE
jgi:hypothetical protein